MSSETTFEQRLEQTYERYRRRNLEKELESMAETMEETLLQQAMAEELFDEGISINEEVKDAVAETQYALECEEYESVANKRDQLSKDIERASGTVETAIRDYQLDMLDIVTAMERLNSRVERVDSVRLQSLRGLLEDWNWKDYLELPADDSFEERQQEAAQIGRELATTFEELKTALFSPYKDTEFWPIVESLLDDERLTYANLSEAERQQLADSDLDEYIELTLS